MTLLYQYWFTFVANYLCAGEYPTLPQAVNKFLRVLAFA